MNWNMKTTRRWRRCFCGILAAVMTVVSVPMVSLADEDREDQALVIRIDNLTEILNETGGEGYHIDDLSASDSIKNALEAELAFDEVITGAKEKTGVYYVTTVSLSEDWDSEDGEAGRQIGPVHVLVINERNTPKKYAVKVDGGSLFPEVEFEKEAAGTDAVYLEEVDESAPEAFDLRENRIQKATDSDADRKELSLSRHEVDILTAAADATASVATNSTPEGVLWQYNETSKVVSGVLPGKSLYRLNFTASNEAGGRKLYVGVTGDDLIRYIYDKGSFVAYCHNSGLKSPASRSLNKKFFQTDGYDKIYYDEDNTVKHVFAKDKIVKEYFDKTNKSKYVNRKAGYEFTINEAGKTFNWFFPTYFKMDYQQVIEDGELNTISCPDFGDNPEERKETADQIINLLYAGYPFDASGAFRKNQESGLSDYFAYDITQMILWSICGDKTHDGELEVMKGSPVLKEYIETLQSAVSDESIREPMIYLSGDPVFREDEGVWRTGLLDAVSGFGGSFYLEGLPKGITVKAEDGSTIKTGVKGQSLKPGTSFYLESDSNPAEDGEKEISFYLVYDYETADIAYYKNSDIPVYDGGYAELAIDYQDLVRIFLTGDSEITSVKAVFKPDGSIEVDPDPGHEPGTTEAAETSAEETKTGESGTEESTADSSEAETSTTESVTEAPTTAPTTEAPTTAPTTSVPTTSAPTASTTAPTTSAPTTAPTTSAPTTAPTTSEPTTAPTTSAPTTSAPTTAPTTTAPTTSAPTIAPTTSAPTTAPTTSAPTTAPTTSAPTTAPTTSAPTTAPTTSAPTTSAPTTAPTTSAPTTAPTTSEPTTAPTTSAPTIAPTTSEPTTAPTTSAPTTSAPTTAPAKQETTAPVRNDSTGGGSSSGGGPHGNGGDSDHGPGVTQQADPDTVIIEDNGVPLAMLPEDNASDSMDNLILIDDGEIPLAGLPKTGDSRSHAGKFFLLSGLFGGIYLMLEKKRKKAE